MSQVDVLPLAFLYVDGQKQIEGITRFQKLVFLAQEETAVDHQYRFVPEKYGPFSHELYDALEQLGAEGLIREQTRTTPGGSETYVYELTDRGRDLVERIRESEEHDFEGLFDAAARLKRRHGYGSLDQLLRYVYESYPVYTANSNTNPGTA